MISATKLVSLPNSNTTDKPNSCNPNNYSNSHQNNRAARVAEARAAEEAAAAAKKVAKVEYSLINLMLLYNPDVAI